MAVESSKRSPFLVTDNNQGDSKNLIASFQFCLFSDHGPNKTLRVLVRVSISQNLIMKLLKRSGSVFPAPIIVSARDSFLKSEYLLYKLPLPDGSCLAVS